MATFPISWSYGPHDLNKLKCLKDQFEGDAYSQGTKILEWSVSTRGWFGSLPQRTFANVYTHRFTASQDYTWHLARKTGLRHWHTSQPSTEKNYPGPDAKSAQVQKSWYGEWHFLIWVWALPFTSCVTWTYIAYPLCDLKSNDFPATKEIREENWKAVWKAAAEIWVWNIPQRPMC